MRANFCYTSKMLIFPISVISISNIVGRVLTLERKPSKKKQRTDIKKDAKRIKSDNFTKGNRVQYCYCNIGNLND